MSKSINVKNIKHELLYELFKVVKFQFAKDFINKKIISFIFANICTKYIHILKKCKHLYVRSLRFHKSPHT